MAKVVTAASSLSAYPSTSSSSYLPFADVVAELAVDEDEGNEVVRKSVDTSSLEVDQVVAAAGAGG